MQIKPDHVSPPQKTPYYDSACPYWLSPHLWALAVIDEYYEQRYPQEQEGGEKNGAPPRAVPHRVQLPQNIYHISIFAYTASFVEAPIALEEKIRASYEHL